jgi:hypothetical protein
MTLFRHARSGTRRPDPSALKEILVIHQEIRPAAEQKTDWRGLLRGVAADALPPLVIFFALRACGAPDLIAYSAGAVIPLARLVIDRIRGRPFNAISAAAGLFLVVSVVLAVISQDTRTVMARGSYLYLAAALACGVSLCTRTPLMLAISRYFLVRSRPELAEAFDAKYRTSRAAMQPMKHVTAVWAAGFGISAAGCALAAYTLPIPVAATVTSLLEPVVALAIAAWTVRYLKRAAQLSTSD